MRYNRATRTQRHENDMNYEDAIEATVTRKEAQNEIAKHDGIEWEEFIEDCGDLPEYSGDTVLGWLGY